MNPDPHAAYVKELAEADDWAGLVRYWIAHGLYAPALDDAIELVRNRARHGRHAWSVLTEYLEQVRANPLEPRRSSGELTTFSRVEEATILLLDLLPDVAGCEQASRMPIAIRAGVAEYALEAASHAIRVGEIVRDDATVAFFRALAARGHGALQDLSAAVTNLSIAVEIYRPLVARRPEIYRSFIAACLDNLANYLGDLGRRDEASAAAQEAVGLYRELVRASRAAFLPGLAISLNNLANHHSYSGHWEEASAAAQEAVGLNRELVRASRAAFLPGLAMSLNNLANGFSRLGRREEALTAAQEATDLYRTLTARENEAFLPNLGASLNNLAVMLGNLGRREEALVLAQEAVDVRRALTRQDKAAFLPDLATSLHNLANKLGDLHKWDEGVAAAQEAVDIRRELATQNSAAFAPNLAASLSSLANSLSDLARREEALVVAQEALAIHRELVQQHRTAFLANLPASLTSAAMMLHRLGRFKEALALAQEAVDCCRELTERHRAAFLPDLALSLHNLAVMLGDMDCRKDALGVAQEVVDICRELAGQNRKAFLHDLAGALDNLGNCLSYQGRREDAMAAAEEAVALFRELVGRNRRAFLPHLARALYHLASKLSDFERRASARMALEESMNCFNEAVAQAPEALLEDRLIGWAHLGVLLLEKDPQLGWPLYSEARDAFRQARDCVERFRSSFSDPTQRKRIQAKSATVYTLLAITCVEIWEQSARDGRPDSKALEEAVGACEAGRARQLTELLADEMLTPHLPPGEEALGNEFADTRRRLLQAERYLQIEEQASGMLDSGLTGQRNPGPIAAAEEMPRSGRTVFLPRSPVDTDQADESPPHLKRASDIRAERDRLAQAHLELVARIRRFDPEFDPDQPVSPATLADLRRHFPMDVPTAFAQFTVTRSGGFALVITPEKVIAVRLPKLTDERENGLLQEWSSAYQDEKRWRSSQVAAQARKARDSGNWEDADKLETLATRLREEWFAAWDSALPSLVESLAERAVRPVVAALINNGLWSATPAPIHGAACLQEGAPRPRNAREGKSSFVRRLVLSPHGSMHLFPLHACRLADGQLLGDAFEVVYTPSLSLLHRCARRRRPTPSRLLATQDPTPDAPLPFAELEGNAIARRFHPEVRRFRGPGANKETLIRTSVDSHVWHFSGHAHFDEVEPLKSALVLGAADKAQSGGWLTLLDVFTRLRLPQATLAVLNGCESGMLRPELADDYVNLPTGFLYAGATCVISTLWTVNDLSSALVMDKFHALWRSGNGASALCPAAALKESVRWLREDIRSGRQLAREILPPLLSLIPDATVRRICEQAADEVEQRYPDSPPFASPTHWAPFVCSGLGYPKPVNAESEQ